MRVEVDICDYCERQVDCFAEKYKDLIFCEDGDCLRGWRHDNEENPEFDDDVIQSQRFGNYNFWIDLCKFRDGKLHLNNAPGSHLCKIENKMVILQYIHDAREALEQLESYVSEL